MKSLKRILTATDFSASARHAVARAFDLAAAANAKLSVMHVVNQGALDGLRRMVGIEPAAVERGILEDARGRLSQLAAELGSAGSVRAETRLEAGTVPTCWWWARAAKTCSEGCCSVQPRSGCCGTCSARC